MQSIDVAENKMTASGEVSFGEDVRPVFEINPSRDAEIGRGSVEDDDRRKICSKPDGGIGDR